jgi:hypothetical protein
MGFISRQGRGECIQRRVKLETNEKRIMRLFRALHVSHDKRVVGEGMRLDRRGRLQPIKDRLGARRR